jgi:hypothetical protein
MFQKCVRILAANDDSFHKHVEPALKLFWNSSDRIKRLGNSCQQTDHVMRRYLKLLACTMLLL